MICFVFFSFNSIFFHIATFLRKYEIVRLEQKWNSSKWRKRQNSHRDVAQNWTKPSTATQSYGEFHHTHVHRFKLHGRFLYRNSVRCTCVEAERDSRLHSTFNFNFKFCNEHCVLCTCHKRCAQYIFFLYKIVLKFLCSFVSINY